MEKDIDYESVRKYVLGLAAAKYTGDAMDENGRINASKVRGAKACLDNLIKKLDADGKAWVSNAIGANSEPYDLNAHAKDILSAAQTAASIYIDKVKKFKPVDFAELFNESFEYYFENEEQRKAARKLLESVGDDSYKKIRDEIERAKPILEKPNLYKEDEVKDAKKKYEKYKPVVQLIEKLQDYSLGKITKKIDEKSDKEEALELVGWKEEKKD